MKRDTVLFVSMTWPCDYSMGCETFHVGKDFHNVDVLDDILSWSGSKKVMQDCESVSFTLMLGILSTRQQNLNQKYWN